MLISLGKIIYKVNELSQVRDKHGHRWALHKGGVGRIESSLVRKEGQCRFLQQLGWKHVRILYLQAGDSTSSENHS